MSTLGSNAKAFLAQTLAAQNGLRTPFRLVDIGARRGIDARWNCVSQVLDIIGFEADSEECDRLNSNAGGSAKYFPYCLADVDGERPFYVRANADASGLVPFPPEFYDRFVASPLSVEEVTREISTRRLDSVLSQNVLGAVDFLKIDAEGAEEAILSGAADLLESGQLLGAEIETRFFHFGALGKFRNVDTIMDRAGLHLFDLGLVRHARGALPDLEEATGRKDFRAWREGAQILATDALFLRDFVHEARTGESEAFKPDLDNLVKMLILFDVYNLPDCAAELIVTFADQFQTLFDPTQALDVLAKLHRGQPDYATLMALANR